MAKNFITEQLSESVPATREKVAFLQQPAAYPYPVTKVEIKETHMSWVFLANGYAYKLKKPVKNQFVDFRSLESRYRNCLEEVRLNKRLAGEIYLDVVPLAIDDDGRLYLQGKGKVVDWLVKMKRIPAENMLDHAIRQKTFTEDQLKQAATLLVEFYKKSPGIAIEPGRYRQQIKEEILATHRELLHPSYNLPQALTEILTAGLLHYLTGHALLFDQRVTGGKIIETHGDLRPEHICLAPAPAIIDCLEFNPNLRIQDTAEELSFLAMECEVMGDRSVEKVFFETYTALTSDHMPASLVTFYKLKKACLRAFLVARHITEEEYKEDPKWLAKANTYLQLAHHYYTQLPG